MCTPLNRMKYQEEVNREEVNTKEDESTKQVVLYHYNVDSLIKQVDSINMIIKSNHAWNSRMIQSIDSGLTYGTYSIKAECLTNYHHYTRSIV